MSALLKNILVMCEEQGVEVTVNGADLDIFFDDYPSDELVDLLRTHKGELLEYLSAHQKRLDSGMKMMPVDVLDKNQPGYQLSFSQQRIWFVEQLEPGTAQFTMPGVFTLKGAVDPVLVERAFAAIVERHLVLSGTYDKDKLGNPLQRLGEAKRFALDQLDFSNYNSTDREQMLIDAVKQCVGQSFDLTRDLMLRATLIKQEEDSYVLLMALHHIAADGLSIGLLLGEFKTLYSALVADVSPELPQLPVQYVDYAAWQQSGFEQGLLSSQVEYWSDKLRDLPLVHSLPTDFSRPQQPGFDGAVVYQSIDSQLLGKVDELCSKAGVSRFTVLYGVFASLVALYGGARDVVIGTPAANRDRSEFEHLIGLFVNSLVLRLDVATDIDFEQLLEQANNTVVEAQENKDLPFEVVVETLNPQRSNNISPLFQLFFTMNQVANQSIDGLEIAAVELSQRIAKYDLTLSASESADSIRLAFEYDKALFKGEFIERFAGHFVTLLGAALNAPKTALNQLTLIDQPQRETLLSLACAANPIEADTLTLHQLIARCCEQNPQSAALACPDFQWDHRTLGQWVDVFADKLRSEGIQSGDKVAIAVQRNSAAVAWLLAIVKVGGAYVPLDASMPNARLQYICQDAEVCAIVGDKSFGADIFELGPKVISAEVENYRGVDITAISQQWPEVLPQQLAYIIYTSGSTGKPKGVKVSHANVTGFIAAMKDRLQPGENGTWLCVTPLAFDISVLETFGALSGGFKVVISPDQRLLSQDAGVEAEVSLADLLEQHQISHIQCTPSMATMLLGDQDIRAKLGSLRQILLGGEVLSESLAVQLASFFNAEIYNMYGPTEATVWATCAKVVAGLDITIGKPLGHASAYVVDQNRQLVPLGAKGELMLTGPCVAQGYQTVADGKAEVFIDSPLNKDDKAYLTGDLVRMNDDGSLQYLGRNDQQVKLRGFRIELADIDSHIESVAGVTSAMAIVTGESYEDKRIIAYFSLNADAEKQEWPQFIKQQLAGKLPEYMVPAHLVRVDHIPMTTSGKKDRRYIGGDDVSQQEAQMVAPQNQTEQTLCDLWCDVLSLEAVGVCNNFFEMGGHSLLLTKLQSAVNEQFGLSLPIRTLFERNTIRAQAEIIDIYLLDNITQLEDESDDEDMEIATV